MENCVTIGINENRWNTQIKEYIKKFSSLIQAETLDEGDSIVIHLENKSVKISRIWNKNISGNAKQYHIGWCASLKKELSVNTLVTPREAIPAKIDEETLEITESIAFNKTKPRIYEAVIESKIPKKALAYIKNTLDCDLPKQKIISANFITGNKILNKHEEEKIKRIVAKKGELKFGNITKTLAVYGDCYDMEAYHLLRSGNKPEIYIWVLDEKQKGVDLPHDRRNDNTHASSFIPGYKPYGVFFMIKLVYYLLTSSS